MPIYVDRHNASGASRADMAEAHRRDLEAQTQDELSFLAYWFDSQQGLAFCLDRAPSSGAVEEVHRVSHGNVPSEIIPVDLEEVGRFLGRTSDPDSPELVDSGYRAILFTDLVGSTSIALEVGDLRAMELLGVHDRIATGAVTREEGVVRELVEDRDLSARLLDAGLKPVRGLESALHVYRVDWQMA